MCSRPDRMYQHAKFRIVIVCLLVVALLLTACGGNDDEKKDNKNYTVGILNPFEFFGPTVDGFKVGMASVGFVEGDNVTYILAGPPVEEETLADLAQTLVDAEVDVIFTIATPGAAAVSEVTAEIPIIFTLVTDPIGAGFVETWAKPGGNLSGLSDSDPDPRRLQILLQIVPSIERVYVPYDPSNQAVQVTLANITAAAEELGLTLITEEMSTQEEIEAAIENFRDDVDALFLLPDAALTDYSVEWGAAAVAAGIPLSTAAASEPENVLMTYGVEFYPSGEQAARFVSQVLNGTDIGALPVEVLDFSLMINLATAEAIGVEVPETLVNLADMIIRADNPAGDAE